MSEDRDPLAHVRHLPINDQLKYGFARYVWPRRAQNCPVPYTSRDGVKSVVTWGELFQRRYKQRLDDYVAFCQANYENPARTSQEPRHAD